MGRGARPKIRWHNERVRRKKARDKRRGTPAADTAAGQTAQSAPSAPKS